MLRADTVRELVRLYDEGTSPIALAKKYGISTASVSRIVTGKVWTEVTGGTNRSRHGKVTEYRAAYIEARLDQGCRNVSQIARELGVTRQAVGKLIKSRGIGGHEC